MVIREKLYYTMCVMEEMVASNWIVHKTTFFEENVKNVKKVLIISNIGSIITS